MSITLPSNGHSMNKKKPSKRKAAAPRRKAPAKASRPPKATAPSKKGENGNATLDLFAQAASLVSNGYLFDAIKLFERVVQEDRKNELADDALVNSGLCYMQMKLYPDAIAQFSRVIQGYPDSTIASVFGGQEVGKTAAKALYCRLRSYLAIGDVPSARNDAKALEGYADSYVVDAQGHKKTFTELGNEALAAVQTAS